MSSPITNLTKHSKEKKKKRKGPGLLLSSDSFDAADVASGGIIIVDTPEESSSRNFSDLKFRAGQTSSPLIQVLTLDVKPVVSSSLLTVRSSC